MQIEKKEGTLNDSTHKPTDGKIFVRLWCGRGEPKREYFVAFIILPSRDPHNCKGLHTNSKGYILKQLQNTGKRISK